MRDGKVLKLFKNHLIEKTITNLSQFRQAGNCNFSKIGLEQLNNQDRSQSRPRMLDTKGILNQGNSHNNGIFLRHATSYIIIFSLNELRKKS